MLLSLAKHFFKPLFRGAHLVFLVTNFSATRLHMALGLQQSLSHNLKFFLQLLVVICFAAMARLIVCSFSCEPSSDRPSSKISGSNWEYASCLHLSSG